MLILLVGLGNPGPQYALNRHNVGFMVMDALAHSYGVSPEKRLGSALVREAKIEGVRVFLAKPLTYMNLSGPAVAQIATFYKIPLENVIVFHDDLDLDFNRVRVKRGGGSGGHNGLKSLDASLGKDYWRVRIGIGHPGERTRVAGYVLQNYTSSELEDVGDLLGDLVDTVPFLLSEDKNIFTTKLASLRSPPEPKG